MEKTISDQQNRRLGFHYFPDSFHYRLKDLDDWLPELKRLGASWLTLIAPSERAIPEYFINGLLTERIQPVLHFPFSSKPVISYQTIRLLFQSYARWGVRWVSLFDRPNCRQSWSAADWSQPDLVERFIDLFLPIAECALEEGLNPIFPPLEPGGDYWDLSFLRGSLQSLQRRNRPGLLEKIALGAYAWTGSKSIGWGKGGPESWPEARPYYTPEGCEDQRGFRIYDWYLAEAQRALGHALPIFLLRAGSLPVDHLLPEDGEPDLNLHAEIHLAIARQLEDENDGEGRVGRIPTEVMACNFWLLSAARGSAFSDQAWFQPDGYRLPVVNAYYRWNARGSVIHPEPVDGTQKDIGASLQLSPASIEKTLTSPPVKEAETPGEQMLPDAVSEAPSTDNLELSQLFSEPSEIETKSDPDTTLADPDLHLTDLAEPLDDLDQVDLPDANIPLHPPSVPENPSTTDKPHPAISHYVLLPLYAWGAADWDLSAIQPLLQDEHPTVGFSLAEARLAAKVTVIGGEGAISPEALEMLRASGCEVERVRDDGMLVAP